MKKGQLTATKLGVYIIAGLTLLVLVYVFFIQQEGGLQKLGRDVDTLKDFIPEIPLEGEELPATQTVLPKDHALAINSLKNAISKALESGNKDCFAEHAKLPDLGEDGTSIEFRYENGKTTMLVYGGEEGRKIIPELTTEFTKMIPCVIAGEDKVAKSFFTKFIEKGLTSEIYHKPTNYVKIFFSEKLYGPLSECDEGNRIITIPLTDENWQYDQGPNYYCNNIRQGGRIFSPDNKHICFMPVYDFVFDNFDQHGIDDDYITGTETNGIPQRLSRGELTQC